MSYKINEDYIPLHQALTIVHDPPKIMVVNSLFTVKNIRFFTSNFSDGNSVMCHTAKKSGKTLHHNRLLRLPNCSVKKKN